MKTLLAILSLLPVISCAEQQNSYAELVNAQGIESARLQPNALGVLTVVDGSHGPIANASVLIGLSPGNPFSGNQLTTDANGQVTFPAPFTASMPVTVSAPGYITETYLDFTPASQSVQLTAEEGTPFAIQGITSGYTGVVNGDGKIDFGLVIPAINQNNWLGFDLSQVISPEDIQLTVLTETINIPSNCALPNQSETYIVAPVKLNSPQYASYVRNAGSYFLSAIHGRFPMQQVISDIKAGKSLFQEINYFTMVGMGDITANVTGTTSGQNLTLDQTMLTSTVTAQAPAISSSQVVLSLALAQSPTGALYATDLKQLTSGQTMKLASAPGLTGASMLSLLMPSTSTVPASHALAAGDLLNINRQNSQQFPLVSNPASNASPQMEQMSLAFQPAGQGAPNFIPLIPAPTVSNGQIQVQVPTLPAGLQPVGTYVVYADILPSGSGAAATTIHTRLWELWQDGFTGSIALPAVSFPAISGHTNRWEVYFLANATGSNPQQGSNHIDVSTVTYATKTSLDVQ